MNEKELIAKLETLKSIRPTQLAISNVQKKVSQKVKVKNDLGIYFNFRYSFFVILALLGIGITYSNNPLLFLTNPYDRSVKQIEIVKQKSINETDLNKLESSYDKTFEELSHLKLKGEEGKYTMQDCLNLYVEFDKTIDMNILKAQQNLELEKDPQKAIRLRKYIEKLQSLNKSVINIIGKYN